MKKVFKTTYLLSLLSIFVIGCAGDRKEHLAQSADVSSMHLISKFNGLTCNVNTQGELYNPQGLSKAANYKIDTNINNANLGFVNYSTNCPFLNDLPFRGAPNTTYMLKYEISLKNNSPSLHVSKIATNETISFHEKTFAIQIDANHYSIPLFRYPITLHLIDNIVDPITNERTSQIGVFDKSKIEEASSFKIAGTRVLMKAVVKEDILPAQFFEGEWFFAYTIVSAHYDDANSIGTLSSDFDFDSKSRIKFEPVAKGLQAVSTSIDPDLQADKIENLEDAIFLPATWVDYRLKTSTGDAGYQEEVLDDQHPHSPTYSARKFVAVNFAQVESKYTEQKEIKVDKTSFENLELAPNYMSFTVYYPKTKHKVKYALRKAPKLAKNPRVYRFDDMKNFGYLFTVKNRIEDATLEKAQQYEELNMIQRFYPKNNVIRFHLSNQTDPKYYKLAQKAIDSWQVAFEKTYEQEKESNKVRIELVANRSNPSKPIYEKVSVGDIRYNIINIIDSKAGESLLGYGPSIVDNESGEIIAATSNVYVHPSREHLINVLRNYIRMKLGILKVNELMQFNVTSGHTPMSANQLAPSLLARIKKNNSRTNEENLEAQRVEREKLQEPSNMREHSKRIQSKQIQRHFNFTNTQRYNIGRIEKECSADLLSYFQKLFSREKNRRFQSFFQERGQINSLDDQKFLDIVAEFRYEEQKKFYIDDEIKVFTPCLDKLLQEDLLVTLIHELGHNFGLAHNFMGSVDKSNYSEIDGKEMKTSSVMDYLPSSVGGIIKVGKYDIAALRFSYLGKIEYLDGSIHKVPEDRSIKDWQYEGSVSNFFIKKYKYCGDSDIYRFDPLCAPNDYGATPIEIVKNIINSYHAFVSIYGKRYDRYYMLKKTKYIEALDVKFFTPLKMFYEKWRLFLAGFTGDGNEYFDDDTTNTPEAFNYNILHKIRSYPDASPYKKFFEEYFEAIKLIYLFLEGVVQEPSKYCLAQSVKDPQITIPFEFEALRKKLEIQSSKTVNSCHDEIVKNYFESYHVYDNNPQIRLHPEVEMGKVYNDLTFSLSDNDRGEVNKIFQYGHKHSKALAMSILTSRIPSLEILKIKNFRPNFFDNPFNRTSMHKYMMSRLENGIEFKVPGDERYTKPYFSRERNFLITSSIDFINSLVLPGKNRLNNEVTEQYTGYLYSIADLSTFISNERGNLVERIATQSQSESEKRAKIEHAQSLKASSILRSAKAEYVKINNDKVLFAIKDRHPFAHQLLNRYRLNEDLLTVIENEESYKDIFRFEKELYLPLTKITQDMETMRLEDFLSFHPAIEMVRNQFMDPLRGDIISHLRDTFYLDRLFLGNPDGGIQFVKLLQNEITDEDFDKSLVDFYIERKDEIKPALRLEEDVLNFQESFSDFKLPFVYPKRSLDTWIDKIMYGMQHVEKKQDLEDQMDIIHAILNSPNSYKRNNYTID